jgi:hypothetical protein
MATRLQVNPSITGIGAIGAVATGIGDRVDISITATDIDVDEESALLA